MNTTQDTPATDSTLYSSEGKRGIKITLDPIRPAAPVIAFGSASAITDLDPQTLQGACPHCFNPAYECICGEG